MIQSTDHKKLKKKGDPSENASIPCRRENKIITGGRGKKGTVLGGGIRAESVIGEIGEKSRRLGE